LLHKNGGFGNKVAFSGKTALQSEAKKFGGRHAWYRTNLNRWRKFCRFLTLKGIDNATAITKDLIDEYSKVLKGKASTAQNDLSAINVVLTLMSGGRWVKFSPSKMSGLKRSFIRISPVETDELKVLHLYSEIHANGYYRLAFIPLFSFYLGLRRREACLLEPKIALLQIKETGYIDILRGTKGGRSRVISRQIASTPIIIKILTQSLDLIGEDRCLVPNNQSLIEFYREISNIVLPFLKQNGFCKLHDLRAAYACNRYASITGKVAPCNIMIPEDLADYSSDLNARKAISKELGHNRVQILNSYIG